MTMIQLSEAMQERLNKLMRPADDVNKVTVAQGLLRAIGDLQTNEERDAAFAYIFANSSYAPISGPPTPAEEYPKPFDVSPDGPDQRALTRAVAEHRIDARLRALEANCEADGANPEVRAQRARAFVMDGDLPIVARAAVLGYLINSDAFANSVDCPKDIPNDEPVSKDAAQAIVWKHRGVLRRVFGTKKVVKTRHALAACIDEEVGDIPDPHERAIVLSHVMYECGQCAAREHIRSMVDGAMLLAAVLRDD
ncbi:hypothetical protein HYV74_03270 [Candidatus Uhrbacteria bacterium]|nr:hypothetical protein [Candidatus Uhrbacteria bacterium]